MKKQNNVHVVETSHASFNGENVRREIFQLLHDKEFITSNFPSNKIKILFTLKQYFDTSKTFNCPISFYYTKLINVQKIFHFGAKHNA